jgi:hypothetical protein
LLVVTFLVLVDEAVQGVAELEQILVATILELQTLAVEVVVLGLQLVAQVVLE